jgi:uncharacterized protein
MAQELQLLIKPASADCNQSCAYCFYRGAHAAGPGAGPRRMSGEVLDALIRRYLRLRLTQSVFCWQGGEPTLMGLGFFERAVRLMQRHGSDGQSVGNALQTNGLLLDRAWCAFLRQYRFLLGLSLDGPAELHDAYRRISPAKGSHEEVLRALRLLQAEQVKFNVLAVVNDVTARHARRLYRYFRELGLTHMQFIPCVEADARSGAPAPFSVAPEAYGDFLCELFAEWLPEARDGVSIRLFDGLLRKGLRGESGLCGWDGACGGCPVVEHDGDVYPCDFFVQQEWRLGNIRTTPLEKLVEGGRARRFRAARHDAPAACSECRWKEFCRGGCMKDRRRISGRFDAPTYFCRSYQRFLPHAEEAIRKLAGELRAADAAPLCSGPDDREP